MVKDWTMDAAQEIATKFAAKQIVTDFTIVDIVKKHCPMQDGVAYMPVPRCETCKHWKQRGIRNFCENKALRLHASLAFTPPIETASDFGCVQWEAR